MKILLISHGLPPESVGGVEQHVEGLARALAAAGAQVEIFSRTSQPGPQFEVMEGETLAGIPVGRVRYRWEDLGSLDDLYEQPQTETALAGWLQDRDFDCAHVHHLTGLSTGCLGVLQRAGIPTALTLHDYWLMCPRGQMWHRAEHPCERVDPATCLDCLQPAYGAWLGQDGPTSLRRLHQRAMGLLEQADLCISPSAGNLSQFAELGFDTSRVVVVENGVDTEALRQLPLPEPTPDTPLRVGYLGTLIPSKGLQVAIEAVGQLGGRCSLDIFGNAVPYHGDEGYLTRAFSRLQAGVTVRYHGPYTTDDLPRILADIDVLAAPALWAEAFGLTVREALAAGRPVLVSAIGGLRDAVEDGVEGRLLPPGDVPALATALAELAADRALLRRMAGAARQRSRSFAAMAGELLGHYQQLVAGRRKA